MYIRIYDWMLSSEKLNLPGKSALVYALIFQMTVAKNGKGCYYAGLSQMGKKLNMTTGELNTIITKLRKANIITSGKKKIDGIDRTFYEANLELARKMAISPDF